jgi:hypothetical protein
MSYRIEHYKRVVTFNAKDDERFPNYLGDVVLFITSGSDNNVSPKDYDWEVEAIGHFSEWGGEIQLPEHFWSAARCADGGMIKPWGRDVSGISYIKSWKQAVKERFPVRGADGFLLWHPRVSVWHWQSNSGYGETMLDAEVINQKGAAVFSPKYEHLRAPLFAAFKRLFPDQLDGSHSSTTATTLAQFKDALYLRLNRSHLPVSLHLTDSAYCPFLTKGAQKELLIAA